MSVMPKPPRLSQHSLAALHYLMQAKRQSGADITRATGTKPGTLYPMLRRLEEVGWLTSKWESGDPSAIGRPLKRLYSLTPAGRSGAKSVLSSLQ